MNLEKVVELINTEIEKQQPKHISSSWIIQHLPQVYRYMKHWSIEEEELSYYNSL